MRSVHLTNYYHKNSGGISTSYNNLLAAAGRNQRHVSLVVPGEKEEVEQVNDYAKIYYIPAMQSPIFDKRYRMIMPWQYMVKDSAVRKILLAEMPDMVEVCDKYSISMLAAMIRKNAFKKLGRPMLVHFSCERMDDNIGAYLSSGKPGKWLARRLMGNYNFGLFDFHIANSAYTAQEFFESIRKADNPSRSDGFFNWCWRFFRASRLPAEERVFICPRAVDNQKYTPARVSNQVRREMRERGGIPESSVALLYAGRISPEKNIGLLPALMEVLAKDQKRDYRLLVAGAGPQAEWLKVETERRCPGKIILLGHLEKGLLADYYANADIFIHPNPKEPFGIAPLEAMASGVPTVAPNSGGILSYANDGNAWLVENDPAGFASAIDEIMENPALRAEKTSNAVETAAQNTWEKSTDRLLAAYDKMFQVFKEKNEFFTDREAAKTFDFAKVA